MNNPHPAILLQLQAIRALITYSIEYGAGHHTGSEAFKTLEKTLLSLDEQTGASLEGTEGEPAEEVPEDTKEAESKLFDLICYYFNEAQPLTGIRQLRKASGMKNVTVCAVVRRLEKRGMIRRVDRVGYVPNGALGRTADIDEDA
jgi:hypothetical protein